MNISDFRLVEIELFSYCNRRCLWCPNSYIDRHSSVETLDLRLLDSLLSELKSEGYQGKFSFSRYNEPFSHFGMLMIGTNLVKHHFPDALLVSNTNGDYINESILNQMLIDELSIMDYGNLGRDKVLHRLKHWHVTHIQEYDHYFVGKYKNKKILYYYSWDEVATISDRGGNLPEYSVSKRDYSCYEPMYFLGINYDGTVSPCCNVRNDCKNQKEFIIGDLNHQTLEDMLSSKTYLDFVDRVVNAEFTSEMPCYYCNNKGGRYTRKNGGILYE